MNLSLVHKARGANLNLDELTCLRLVIQEGWRGDGRDLGVSLDVLAWQGIFSAARKSITYLERRCSLEDPVPAAHLHRFGTRI